MSSYTNLTNVPLSMAVYLATDHYDYEPGVISATGLIKPVRQTILSSRVPAEKNVTDVLQLVKSRMGTSIHDGIEKAWLTKYSDSMKRLGYPQHIIDQVTVVVGDAPIPEDVNPEFLVVMEKRLYRQLGQRLISGKPDFIGGGGLEDFKSTGTYTWIKGLKTEDYQLQGSIYRWLDPELITKDFMTIQFLFTDWSPGFAAANKLYPPRPVEKREIPLLTLDDTEDFIRDKLRQIEQYKSMPDEEIPRCTDDQLWRDEPVYKYYKNPAKMTRSTKNFDTKEEAAIRLAEDGNVGVVVTKPGQVKACRYCRALPVCQQAAEYLADGSLVLN